MQGYISGLDSLSSTLGARISAINSRVQSALNAAGSLPGGGGTGRGYAAGTTSAQPGFALVGEEGPELVFFHGGEQILTAEETAALQRNSLQVTAFDPGFLAALSAYEAPAGAASQEGLGAPSVQITFEIQGDVTSEAMDRLETYGDVIAQLVLDTLAQTAENAKRGAYS